MNENLKVKAQEFIAEQKKDPSYPLYITRFTEYCEKSGKDIADFTQNDFENFLKPYSNPHTVRNIKSIVSVFLNFCGHTEAADTIRSIKTSQITPELNYIMFFDDLKAGIKQVRDKQYEDLGETPMNPLVCDKYSLGEVVLYLAWIGIPRDTLVKLPLSAINLEKNCIEYDDNGIHREFSFADNPDIIDVFDKYSKSTRFVGTRVKNGKLEFINGDYYGDTLIRLGTPPKDNRNPVENIKSTLTRVFTNFKFAVDYKNVYFSGAFSRGFDKIMQGVLPLFTPEGIKEYFGIIAETQATQYTVKRQWENYISWRQEVEGKDFGIDMDAARTIRMNNIAVAHLSALTEFPDDDELEITVKIKELKDLMQAVYNLGSADLR